ncbi:helix-turn-helix transcriptional regulator [Galactobacter caseinivorans]|uniref:XRE family transcriptional regulator n=1 Tax=Galactobacter caseinivorans TaxID=2676123 RepID=A0A496PMZ0_9MICC|nr:helix-turn-helix transcriptional regulator [Galactobacter caseinivorans]RKW71902.1 XRE family transcriptional regulator [Galactobacter caseinivorans]
MTLGDAGSGRNGARHDGVREGEVPGGDAQQRARKELGAFLRGKRTAADRAEYGLPPVGRGKTTGMRREEIAFLSGVSVTWYTWLEQGRDIHPSRQVVDAVAVNLRLNQAEHDYVLGLSGFTPSPRPVPLAPGPVPAHVQQLLDTLDPAPAFAVSPHWDIAAWNQSYEGLFPGIATAPPEERNLLALVFTDEYVRAMLPEWELTSRQFLGEYRSEAGARMGGPAHVRLVAHLRHASPDFAAAWDEHAVLRFESRQRRFIHPVAGELLFDQLKLVPQDAPELHVVAYLPDADSGTAGRLPLLLPGSPTS